nr:unnamed protein product [Callosobruchus chinensis]
MTSHHVTGRRRNKLVW